MTGDSINLSVTSVGRAVAQSVLHPCSADQLIDFAANRADDLLALTANEANEETLQYTLLHAAYSSAEYSVRGSNKALPYQLDALVMNQPADASEEHLIESPWRRNPSAANAAMVAMRWAEGQPRNKLSQEFPPIGSGVSQTMIHEGADILSAWSDCLLAATGIHLVDEDRPTPLRDDQHLLAGLRHLAAVIRAQARLLRVGVPANVAWMASLSTIGVGGPTNPILPRRAILALREHGFTEPVTLLRGDTFTPIIAALRPLALPNLDHLVRSFREAVREYRQDQRRNLWALAIERAPDNIGVILQEMEHARGTEFERRVEAMLDAVGISYTRLDDGRTPGAADLHIGLNHRVQVVVELKSALGEGRVGLNEATDVISGAAIVELGHLPKATIANPGFDPNVAWQARNVTELALVEACQFGYGLSLLAQGEIDKDTFLNWLAQPGVTPIPLYGRS